MSRRVILGTVLALGLLAPPTFAATPAQEAHPRAAALRARQVRQLQRIRAGRERGVIDQTEARRLVAIERRLHAAAVRLRESDNRLTMAERLWLHRGLNRASRAILRATRGGR